MQIDRIDKGDKKLFITVYILGVVMSFFWGKFLDITFLGLFLYLLNKNIPKGMVKEKIEKEYKIEYIDEEIYYKRIKQALVVINIYGMIRLLTIITIEPVSFNIIEIFLISPIFSVYYRYLERKYIKTVEGVEVERKIKLVNNKLLTLVIFVVFIGYSYIYFSNIDKTENSTTSPKYTYNVKYKEDGNREVELKSKDRELVALENKENESYFEKYIKRCKLLINLDIFNKYAKVAEVFMILLLFSQVSFKKDEKVDYIVSIDLFFIGAVIFSLFILYTYSYDLEQNTFGYAIEHKLYID